MADEPNDLSPRASRFIGTVFQSLESGDETRFLSLLDANAEVRIGGGAPIRSRDAIARTVRRLFQVASRVDHKLDSAWERDDTLEYRAEIRLVFRYWRAVSVPYAATVEFQGNIARRFIVYIDILQLVAEPALFATGILLSVGIIAGWCWGHASRSRRDPAA